MVLLKLEKRPTILVETASLKEGNEPYDTLVSISSNFALNISVEL